MVVDVLTASMVTGTTEFVGTYAQNSNALSSTSATVNGDLFSSRSMAALWKGVRRCRLSGCGR
jgi:hypothetical protein